MLSKEIFLSILAAIILPATYCLECFCGMTWCNWRSYPTEVFIFTAAMFSFLPGILHLTTKSTQESHHGSCLMFCVLLLWHSELNQSINFFHQELSDHDITIQLSLVLENQLSLTKMSSNLFSTIEAKSL